MLGEYRRINLVLESLDQHDRDDLAALFVDKKYKSLLKLQNTIKVKMLNQIVYNNLEDSQIALNKAGVQMLIVLENVLKDYFKGSQEKIMKENHLKGFGW